MILGGLALFIAGSIGCALSQDLPRLLAFRALQAFTQLMTNTVVAGVLSPLLSEHPRHLAIGMTGFFLLGWLFLRWERRRGRRLRHRQATKAVPLEPADHLLPHRSLHVHRFQVAP
ncbi:hypothetical protein ADT26_05930 [Xanthomonas oryzae]|nr:hypothetical protein ADT26_05930 [Xanthomonas oryzae]